MPNIKSAKKRVLVNDKKTEQNKNIRSAVKTEIKKVDLLIKEGKLEDAKVALSNAFAVIDAACSKNIYHKNNASNKKSKNESTGINYDANIGLFGIRCSHEINK